MSEAMVAAAVGATIKVVLENLLSFPVEDIGLVWNFKKDLNKLKKSVITVRDFLEDAETKQVSDKPLQRWLMKLEAVAFDADYVFDELNYHVLRNKIHKVNKVSSFFSTSNPTLFRRRMAKKVKDIKNELNSINEEASQLGLQTRIACAASAGARTEAPAYMETDSFSVEPVFVGREKEVAEMVEMLTSSLNKDTISVFPIVGMGGLGKSELARKVFSDGKIVSHFGDLRVWIHVPENFEPVKVLKKILESWTREYVSHDLSREVILRKLADSFGDKRYILVLDNIWNEETEKWENLITSLKGISRVKGNVIIVTTRNYNVASIVKTNDALHLGILSVEDCWFLIKVRAFRERDIPSEFKTIGKTIARRCGGLPLAARHIGSLLRCKSKDEWVSIEKKLNLEGVRNVLKLSYDNLSSPSVKKCSAFCSILPKGCDWIEKDTFIDLWMAEGFLQNDPARDMEIVGDEVFHILINSSLLQVRTTDAYGNVTRCVMHDLVYDFALSVLNSEFTDRDYQTRYKSTPFTDEEHAKILRAFFCCGKISSTMFSNMKRLHVLILVGEDITELSIEIGKLISLRFLDISHTRIECLPDSIGDLYHLQTLLASKEYGGTSYLSKLPDTFKHLISLRHLYISNIGLPPEIGKLVSLQTLPYFHVGKDKGCGITEIGSLKNLKGEIEIHNLEKVGDKEEAESADLLHKPNILKLKLVWNIKSEEGETNDENVLEGLQPHPNLKSLEINGFKGTSFPLWTLRMAVRGDLEDRWLDNLMEIKLSGCVECKEVPMLGHLPHLKWLYLHGLSNVKSMGSLFYGIEENGVNNEVVVVFPVLEKLELVGMANLLAWDEVELGSSSISVFGCLAYLKIHNCRELKSAPSQFPCLKELEIDNMKSGLPLAMICGSKLTSLTKLNIAKVDGLTCLPDWLFSNNRDLLMVKIQYCRNLTHLVPCLGGGATSLKKMEIRKCFNFAEFPEDLHSLHSLEELMITVCPNMKSIPYPSGGQLSLQGGFTSLRKLEILYCTSLSNLPIQMIESCMSSLEWLILMGSMSMTNLPQVMNILPNMPRLTQLSIEQVPKFSAVAAEIGSLRGLVGLGIGGSSDSRDYISFKESIGCIFPALHSLRSLSLFGTARWDALPDQLQYLTTLRELYLTEFGIEELPEWFGNFLSLKYLGLNIFQKLRRLPSTKGMLCFTKLIINECPILKQNLLDEEGNEDSEWSKISHIPTIMLDGNLISAPAQKK